MLEELEAERLHLGRFQSNKRMKSHRPRLSEWTVRGKTKEFFEGRTNKRLVTDSIYIHKAKQLGEEGDM